MNINVFNTLGRKKEALAPRVSGKIAMYVCGPTVYGYIHIGNARTFLNFDLIRRYLKHRGFEVTYVQNITDVDDKIIKRAQEEKSSAQEVADKYTLAFQEEMRLLGVEKPDYAPKATEFIPKMVEMIVQLIERGLAYEVEGDVYFEIRKFPGYGKLSGRSLEELRAGERVDIDPRKRDPLDFALWKTAKPGEPSWESPWGAGRPGWHIECSAMSLELLQSSFDIHGGAQDLIFPHHENEVAQSEGASGKPFAKYWLHGGLLSIDKEKMSKSVGNIFILKEVLDRWEPSAIRLFMMTAHYRQPLDFNLSSLDAAAVSLERLRETMRKAGAFKKTAGEDSGVGAAYQKYAEAFHKYMDDDFNAPAAVAELFDMAKQINSDIDRGNDADDKGIGKAADLLSDLFGVLGVDIEAKAVIAGVWEGADKNEADSLLSSLLKKDALSEEDIKTLAELRNWFRKEKDFEKADSIRDHLEYQKVILEDIGSGETRWHFIVTSDLHAVWHVNANVRANE